jgi:hypothetical protein
MRVLVVAVLPLWGLTLQVLLLVLVALVFLHQLLVPLWVVLVVAVDGLRLLV